jgi:hypothetical protein
LCGFAFLVRTVGAPTLTSGSANRLLGLVFFLLACLLRKGGRLAPATGLVDGLFGLAIFFRAFLLRTSEALAFFLSANRRRILVLVEGLDRAVCLSVPRLSLDLAFLGW